MKDFSRYLGIKKKLLICCMFWIFSAAEGNTIVKVVGSTVMLPCYNKSMRTLNQLTWKKNAVNLLSYKPPAHVYYHPGAEDLNISKYSLQNHSYELTIERVEKSHTGNYTCEAVTETGLWEQTLELIITDHQDGYNINPLIPVAVIVPCVCCLIFIFAIIIKHKAYKRRAENSTHCPTAGNINTQQEDIYENCLEMEVGHRPSHRQPHRYNQGSREYVQPKKWKRGK